MGLDRSGRLRGAVAWSSSNWKKASTRASLLPAGESVDLGTNLVARRPQGGPWPHPLLAVDAHTIVTGSEEALRQLVARGGDAELASGPMELLLKKLSPGGDLAVMVDLSPART